MKREKLLEKLKRTERQIKGILNDGGIEPGSALCGYITAASLMIWLAQLHIEEYNEEFADDVINNPKKDKA